MPRIQIPEKLLPILDTKSRFIVLLGGRDSAKSGTAARYCLSKCQTEAADILCGREFQNSIDDSVHKLLSGLINKIPLDGFSVTDKKIDCDTGGGFRFKGFARNPDAVKSAQDFKYSWGEEAQSFSDDTITQLLPTIRENDSKLLFTANPRFSIDPFSKRFINPFLKDLKAYGYYSDELHLIIWINYKDNPWHKELEAQRVWDYENLSRAMYDHIWEGAFLDSVEDALIKPEWFDACIDAHKVLGFDPRGGLYTAHDPADEGANSKTYALRHGSVLQDLQQTQEGNVNYGGHWATRNAIEAGADFFIWDCDGLGAGLNEQVSADFAGKKVKISQFRGSESPDNPEAVFEPAQGAPIRNQRKVKDAVRNKRAQKYYDLRKRFYKTFLAVTQKKYSDPEQLISIDSSIELIPLLRSQLCTMPTKPNGNGIFEMYTKQELKKKFKYDSPDLADVVMMSFADQGSLVSSDIVNLPHPIKSYSVSPIKSRRLSAC